MADPRVWASIAAQAVAERPVYLEKERKRKAEVERECAQRLEEAKAMLPACLEKLERKAASGHWYFSGKHYCLNVSLIAIGVDWGHRDDLLDLLRAALSPHDIQLEVTFWDPRDDRAYDKLIVSLTK